ILEVIAGGEHAASAGYHEAADVRIVLRGIDGVAHGAVHALRHGVLLLRPSHLDDARVLVVGDNQVLGHAASPEGAAAALPQASHWAISYMIPGRAQVARIDFSRRTGMNKTRCPMREYVAQGAKVPPLRHARACPGHPRLWGQEKKDVDGRDRPGHDGESYASSTASAPFTASALSVTVFSSEVACTAMFSAKNRASAT